MSKIEELPNLDKLSLSSDLVSKYEKQGEERIVGERPTAITLLSSYNVFTFILIYQFMLLHQSQCCHVQSFII